MTPHPKRSCATGGVENALGVARSRLAEQKPEPWAGGTKPIRRRHREVELKRVRQQEHAVGRRSAHEVDKVHCVELSGERARPVIEHVGDRHVVGDAEGEVQVGVAVAFVHCQRADGGSGDDALVLLREP